jgi:nicotinamidase-related amidase
MREANDRGFDCVVLEDGTAASEPSLHMSAIESVKMEGGIFGAVSKVEDLELAIENFKSVTVKKLAPQMTV